MTRIRNEAAAWAQAAEARAQAAETACEQANGLAEYLPTDWRVCVLGVSLVGHSLCLLGLALRVPGSRWEAILDKY